MSITSSPLSSVLSPAVVSVFGSTLTEQVLSLSPNVLFNTSNLSSLYQDSAGTTPVTQAADPVGLVLDKSQMNGKTAAQFIADQPELVTNGDFSNGLTGWGDHSSAGGTISFVGESLHIENATGNARVHGEDILEEGKTYILTLNITGATCSIFQNRSSDKIGDSVTGLNTFIFKAVAAAGELSIRNFTAGTTAIVDNVSIKEIPGNHILNSTASQRPLYQADGSLLFDGVDDKLEAAVSGFTDECAIAIDFVFQGGADHWIWPIALNDGTGSSSDELGFFIHKDRSLGVANKMSLGGVTSGGNIDTSMVSVGDRITLVMSINGSSVVTDIYRNGAFINTDTQAANTALPTLTKLQLATSSNAEQLSGKFKRCAVFNKALTGNEMALVAQWMLEV
jgi:hypothetical protein